MEIPIQMKNLASRILGQMFMEGFRHGIVTDHLGGIAVLYGIGRAAMSGSGTGIMTIGMVFFRFGGMFGFCFFGRWSSF